MSPLPTIAAGILLLAGLALLVRALLLDRPGLFGRPRFRCRRCAYDMTPAAAAPAPFTCPECGRRHRSERDLRRPRRHPRLALLALLLIAAAYPTRHASTIRQHGPAAALPTWALVAIVPPEALLQRGDPFAPDRSSTPGPLGQELRRRSGAVHINAATYSAVWTVPSWLTHPLSRAIAEHRAAAFVRRRCEEEGRPFTELSTADLVSLAGGDGADLILAESGDDRDPWRVVNLGIDVLNLLPASGSRNAGEPGVRLVAAGRSTFLIGPEEQRSRLLLAIESHAAALRTAAAQPANSTLTEHGVLFDVRPLVARILASERNAARTESTPADASGSITRIVQTMLRRRAGSSAPLRSAPGGLLAPPDTTTVDAVREVLAWLQAAETEADLLTIEERTWAQIPAGAVCGSVYHDIAECWPGWSPPTPHEALDEIIDILQNAVHRTSWADNGGENGQILRYGTTLLLCADDPLRSDAADFLRWLDVGKDGSRFAARPTDESGSSWTKLRVLGPAVRLARASGDRTAGVHPDEIMAQLADATIVSVRPEAWTDNGGDQAEILRIGGTFLISGGRDHEDESAAFLRWLAAPDADASTFQTQRGDRYRAVDARTLVANAAAILPPVHRTTRHLGAGTGTYWLRSGNADDIAAAVLSIAESAANLTRDERRRIHLIGPRLVGPADLIDRIEAALP